MKKIKYLVVVFLLMFFVVGCTQDGTNTTNANSDTTYVDQNGNVVTVSNSEEGIDFMTALVIIVVVIIVVAFSFFFFKNVFPVGLWFKAWTAGVRVGVRAFFNMYFQKIPPDLIVNNMITSRKAGVFLKVRKLEDFYLANIDIDKIVKVLIQAYNAHVTISIDQLANAYLGKVNIEELIEAMILVQGADIETDFDELVKMYHTGVDIVKIVKSKIEAKNSGYPILFKQLAEHYLAGGNLDKSIDAYVSARKANLKDFDFQDIADIDLAGYNVYSVVEKAIIPSVVEGDKVRGVARDGVELLMKLKVTLRAKLKHIIGNPEESTILARINESLASEIGITESHFVVLQSPFLLADRVEQKKLDFGTAFEILSIDVSDVEIGKDVHAELRTERAKADAFKARADLIKADEKLKKSMAAAFLEGNLSHEEYEKLVNMQADTRMRNSLSNDQENENNNHNHNDEH